MFEERPSVAGKISEGIKYFCFRLVDTVSIAEIIETLKKLNAEIPDSVEFVADEPYIFLLEPNGYEIEVWYEKPPGAPFL